MHVDTTGTTIIQDSEEAQDLPFTSIDHTNLTPSASTSNLDVELSISPSTLSTPPPITSIPSSEDHNLSPTASRPHRLFLDLFAGHSAPLSVAAREAHLDSFEPFDLEFNHICDILNDDLFETLLRIAHTGLVGAIWSAPPCKLYSRLRRHDGGPPPLRSAEFMEGLPGLTSAQLASVQESREIHRRSSVLCTAVYQQGGFAAQEQPINSLAWKEPFHQSFLTRCSCHFVSTPACKFGLDWYKTWAVAATSERIHLLAGSCQHHTHYSVRGKRLPDGTYISSLTAEYPSLMASAIVDIIRPWVSQNSHCYNPILPPVEDTPGQATYFSWTSYHRWCRRHQLRQLDHTILSGHLQSSQTEMVHPHPIQTSSYPCHAVQSETHYRSLHFGRGTHPIPPGSTRLFPFRNTGYLDPTFSTLSPAAPPRTLGPLSRPRSPYRRTIANWYPLWSIHSFGTYQPLGEKHSSTGGYTRITHLSRQLDECQPEPSSYYRPDPGRIGSRLHRGNTRPTHSREEMAQRNRHGKTGRSLR